MSNSQVQQAPSLESLQMLHRNALRLLKLVNGVLDFVRIEVGRMQATYQPTDLSMLTAQLASVFRSAVERAGLKLIVAAGFVAYLIEYGRALATRREPNRETLDTVLLLAVGVMVIWALPAFALDDIVAAVGRVAPRAELPLPHLLAGQADRQGALVIEQSQLVIGDGRRLFDAGQGVDELGVDRDGGAGDRKIFQRTQGVNAVVGVGRHYPVAEEVMLGPYRLGHGRDSGTIIKSHG